MLTTSTAMREFSVTLQATRKLKYSSKHKEKKEFHLPSSNSKELVLVERDGVKLRVFVNPDLDFLPPLSPFSPSLPPPLVGCVSLLLLE